MGLGVAACGRTVASSDGRPVGARERSHTRTVGAEQAHMLVHMMARMRAMLRLAR